MFILSRALIWISPTNNNDFKICIIFSLSLCIEFGRSFLESMYANLI